MLQYNELIYLIRSISGHVCAALSGYVCAAHCARMRIESHCGIVTRPMYIEE